jgi:predicted O-methyltransferase YrrM
MGSAERVRDVRERLVTNGTFVGRDGRVHDLFPVAIGGEEGLALLNCVRRVGARRTLETGLGYAISALFLIEGLLENGSDVKHVAADPYQFEGLPHHRTAYGGVGVEILDEAGARDRAELYIEESQVVLPRLLADGRVFDLAFLDGNHRFEAVFLDLFYSGRLLEEGGVIFVDDTQLAGVRRAVDFYVANLGWTIEDGGVGAGHEWLVVRTGSHEAFQRPYTEFVDF